MAFDYAKGIGKSTVDIFPFNSFSYFKKNKALKDPGPPEFKWPGSRQDFKDYGSGLRPAHSEKALLEIDPSYPKKLTKGFSKTRIHFVYLPNEISVSGAEPQWNETEVIGRWEPYQVYSGTSAEEISMTLTFLAEESVALDVIEKVDFLRAMKYPVIYNGLTYRPPTLIFTWGSFLSKRVIITEATPTYKGPWKVNTSKTIGESFVEESTVSSYPLQPMQADVSLTMRVVSVHPVDCAKVMRGEDTFTR